jgi:CRP/FNR family cyclic AMP-dependent transcriptional regulator
MKKSELMAVFEGSSYDQEIIHNMTQILRQYGTLKKYEKGQFIFKEDDPSDAVFLVEKGLLKVSQSTQEGQNVTFFIQKTGDLFGFAELILQTKRERYAQCLNDCHLLVLNAVDFMKLARTDVRVSYGLLLLITGRFLLTQKTVVAIVSKPVSWRLAWLLKQIGAENRDGQNEIELELTHDEISNIIGCSRQTVTEIFNRWRSEGLITYTRKKVVLHDVSFLPCGFT